jgi:very-short-patch-repair endonuclease
MKHRAAELRQEMTLPEQKLWTVLRAHRLDGVSFRRQHAIGPYVADFCCPRQKLVIELDGCAHQARQKEDAERTQTLEALGYRVLRFWNSRVMDDLPGVLSAIRAALKPEG